jgi:S-DNA-T family DNA segregation ATPase FtsK/SpoIIIE
VTLIGGSPLEVQIALPLPLDNESRIAKGARVMAGAMARTWTGRWATPIPEIPKEPTWQKFRDHPSVRSMLNDPRCLPFGYDAKTANIYAIDLSRIYTYCITGAAKKGKTNALRVIALAAKAKGARVILVDYGKQSSDFAQDMGIEYVSNEQEFFDFISDFRFQVSKRNQAKAKLVKSGLAEREVFDGMQEFEQVFVLIDDLPAFVTSACRQKTEGMSFKDYMNTVLERCAQHNIYWFGTVNREQMDGAGIQSMFKIFTQEGFGAHFGGRVRSTALPSFSFAGQSGLGGDKVRPAGRAMLSPGDDVGDVEIVVPLAQGGPR